MEQWDYLDFKEIQVLRDLQDLLEQQVVRVHLEKVAHLEQTAQAVPQVRQVPPVPQEQPERRVPRAHQAVPGHRAHLAVME
jgi:hypothetical protein